MGVYPSLTKLTEISASKLTRQAILIVDDNFLTPALYRAFIGAFRSVMEFKMPETQKVAAMALLQTFPKAILVEVRRGEVDLNRLAALELANRGLDPDGRWVGFERALLLNVDVD